MADNNNDGLLPVKLSAREIELLLWQLVSDLGGEVSTPVGDDKPERRMLYFRDGVAGDIVMVAEETELPPTAA